MEIAFKCEKCGQELLAPEGLIGSAFTCPNPECGCSLTVPSSPKLPSEVLTQTDDITFDCPFCDHELVVDKSGTGMAIACPSCGKTIVIPEPATPVHPANAPLAWSPPPLPSVSYQSETVNPVEKVALQPPPLPSRTTRRIYSLLFIPVILLSLLLTCRFYWYQGHRTDARREPTPVKMGSARSNAAQQLRKYLDAAAQRNAVATEGFLAKECKDYNSLEKLYYLRPHTVDRPGCSYAEDRSRILREIISPDGTYAIVTAALVYQRSGEVILYHNDFFFVKEEGTWKVLGGGNRVLRFFSNPDKTLRQTDYTGNLEKLDNNSSLYTAVRMGSESLVRFHLAMGADVNAQGGTALMEAVKKGNERMISLLIEKGANVNVISFGFDHMTPLMLAIREGREPLVRLLIDKGADVNVNERNEGVTALILAVKGGQEPLVRLLIEKGADVNVKVSGYGNPFWMTALMFAVEKGQETIVRLLIDNGVDVNAKTDLGDTALAIVLFHMAFESDDEKHQGTGKFGKIAHLLVEKGADPNSLSMYATGIGSPKRVALQEAISSGYEDLACLLIEKGADIGVKIWPEESILMNAAFYDQLQVAKLLIARGVNVNEKDSRGNTALGTALANGHDELARFLIEHGAKPSSKQEEQRAAMLRGVSP